MSLDIWNNGRDRGLTTSRFIQARQRHVSACGWEPFMKAYGGMEVKLHIFLTSKMYKWSPSRRYNSTRREMRQAGPVLAGLTSLWQQNPAPARSRTHGQSLYNLGSAVRWIKDEINSGCDVNNKHI